MAWQSPVLLHPTTAAEKGLRTADVVRVTAPWGSLEAPVYAAEVVHPGLALMAAGQGHTAYGRYAANVGANPLSVLPAAVEPNCGGPGCGLPDIRLEATGRRVELACTDGSRIQHGRAFILTTTPADLRKGPPPAKNGLTMDNFPLTLPRPEGYNPQRDFYPPHDHDHYRWAMVVDLDRCTGCGACAAAGTTIIEAALLNRNVIANDVNPLSAILSKPRLVVPSLADVENQLRTIKFRNGLKADIDLSMFYHADTASEIVSLRNYLIKRKKNKEEDFVDEWIRMVATNRLTGHSKNFFSVYTLPPNQAVSQERQKKINNLLKQKPEYKDVKFIILKKTRDLTSGLSKRLIDQLKRISSKAIFLNEDARTTSRIKNNSVKLPITSPPFLDIVNYAEDNWLRCWFNNIDARKITQRITVAKKIDEWEEVMEKVFKELYRITKIRELCCI